MRTIVQEGVRYYEVYGDDAVCPYLKGTEERKQWVQGWGLAMRKYEAERLGIPNGLASRSRGAPRSETLAKFKARASAQRKILGEEKYDAATQEFCEVVIRRMRKYA